MSDLRIVPWSGSLSAVSGDGSWTGHQGTRDGAAFMADWMEKLALMGRVFHAANGSVTTPLTFLVTAANRPDAWIRVPSGTSILPLKVNYALEAYAGTAPELALRVAENDIGNATSTAATAGPRGSRTDNPLTSNCTVRHLATGDATAETNPISIFRRTIAAAEAAGNDFAGSGVITREMMGYPGLVGPASLILYIAATTTQATGFVMWSWAEVPTAQLVS